MNNILDRYNNIDDIKKMNEQELNIFADEIRKFLIEKTAKTGGHLASNLGVVELTLSLYKTFDFNKDKLIWDVGHQSYIHKILTGRKNSFDNLRQYGGISGFPKREESKYDIFNVGHSSTSISAALGIARGRDLSGDNYDIISVIGDGALTSGMALEALNDLGYSKNKVLIILNDNQMSIDKNVGGLSLYLSKIRLDPKYNKIKRDLNGLIRKIPTVGKGVANSIEKLKDGVKQILIPGMFFEDIGIKYLGPVDGHDIKKMCEVFEKTKHINGPIVIHVVTKKGKGYKFAENKPDKFHGIGPFNPCTGETLKKSSMTYSKAFGEAMIEIAEKNKKVIGITAAMPDGTGLREFSQKFKNRYFDVGIAEEHAVTMAAGLAVSGYKPVFAVYSTFLQRAYDQIVHDVCMQKLPVIFAVDRAGIVGHDGETHQGIFDISYLSHIPNIVIMTPKCIDELKYMLNWAVEQKYPIAIRYPRGKDDSRVAMSPLKNIKLGKWEVLCNGGNIIILAIGNMVQKAILVKEMLAKEGIKCTIVNACFIKPLDKELIYNLIKSQHIIVTLEDNILKGGFGSYILEYANTLNLPYNILTLGYEDKFISHGDVKQLYKMNGLDEEGICKKILEFKHKIENGEEK